MYPYGISRTVKVKGGITSKDNVEKPPTRKSFLIDRFIEFCKRTDLHGYKYIVMEDLSTVERSCWALAVVVSIAVAASFVVTAYRWYARNPIVTVIESTQGAIWDVPFPAVTICDLNMVSKRAAMSLASNMSLPENVTKESVLASLRLIPLLHSMYVPTLGQKQQLRELQRVLDLNDITVESLFRSVSPAYHCSDLVQKCMWKNTIYRCDHLFQQVFTLYNLCCTFNYYAVEPDKKDGLVTIAIQSSQDQLISKTCKVHYTNFYMYRIDPYTHIYLIQNTFLVPKEIINSRNYILRKKTPRRVASCGYQTGLTVLLNTNIDDYYSASVASQGALVFIDSAYNVPNHDSPARMVNPSTEVLIALSPERTYATSGIKSFTAEQRQCYYSDESIMNDFSEFSRYSLHNCMAYLEVKVIGEMCNCVPFFFPVKRHHRACNFDDMDCLESAIKSVDGVFNNTTMDTLQCLPECEHFDYPIEVAMGKLANPIELKGLPFLHPNCLNMVVYHEISSCLKASTLLWLEAPNVSNMRLTCPPYPILIYPYDVNLKNQSVLNVFFNDLVSTRYRRDVYLNWQNILAAFGGLLSLMLGFTLISGIDLLIFLALRVVYQSFSIKFAKTPPKVHAKDDVKINPFFDKTTHTESSPCWDGQKLNYDDETHFNRMHPVKTVSI